MLPSWKKKVQSVLYWIKVCSEIDCSLMLHQPKIGFLQMHSAKDFIEVKKKKKI